VIRVLIADPAEPVRSRLAAVLTAAGGIEVVGAAEDGRMACSAVVAVNPDVVLLAADLPRRSGPDTAAWLRTQRPAVRVVALASATDPTARQAMREAGAVCAVDPDAPPAELTAAVLTAVAAL
jgi:DNA-binding NarL/FixJ family response regulator